MRLLYLNHNYPHSGSWYRAMPMARQIAARGHDVTFFCVSRSKRWVVHEKYIDGVRLIEGPNLARQGTAEGYAPQDILARCWHTLKERYDIVHCIDHKPNVLFASWPARWRGAKVVADWVDWWSGESGINAHTARWIAELELRWEERSKLNADGVLTISTVLAKRARDLGCDPLWVEYLPTGAALDRIQPVPIAQARATLNIPVDQQLLGFIGVGQGDLDEVMEALQAMPDVHLMVIGRHMASVTRLAEQFGVRERVWQTGFIPDTQVSTYLACANAMVLPLLDRNMDRGRLPNKLLDYMCAARPTITNPVGDTERIVKDYGAGILVDRGALSPALSDLLNDPARCESIGRQARQAAEAHFAWPALIDQLEAFYRRILDQGGQHA